MSWWSSSWLPTFPSIDFSLPTGIQRRFISFALRRSLGHFLKPGQLDIQQVDSQIGSGYVQVRDLELDNEAINSLISGLPVRLHDGSVGKVTARIPWPNPLTSTIGIAIESLHLTFYLNPSVAKPSSPTGVNLAESVASVAESFIHEELSPREEATLRESFHPDLAASTHSSADNVPGGLDPFISDEEVHGETDPPGVSIFATLIERLLARFEFDAVDTQVTLVHPQHSSFTLIIPSVHYGTEVRNEGPARDTPTSATGVGETQGETRIVIVSGISVTTRCLRPLDIQAQSPPTPSSASRMSPVEHRASPVISTPPGSPPPSSPYSDSSDMDEETQMMMSQSIVSLPPRPVSPASTVASSMYESALSTAPAIGNAGSSLGGPSYKSPHNPDNGASTKQLSPEHVASSPLHVQISELVDETIVSFASESIVFRLSTPPPLSKPSGSSSPESATLPPTSRASLKRHPKPLDKEPDNRVRLDLTIGVIACAFRARHIRNILDIAQLWSSHTPHRSVRRTEPLVIAPSAGPSLLDEIEAGIRLRGVMLLLLPASKTSVASDSSMDDYFAHPLIPPRLQHGFVRVHFDDLFASYSMSAKSEYGSGSSHGKRATVNIAQVPAPRAALTATLSELSAFSFVMSLQEQSSGVAPSTSSLYAVPLLITDPQLPSQYSLPHIHPDTVSPDSHRPELPEFEVVNWMNLAHSSSAPKLSIWRTRPSHHSRSSHAHSPSQYGDARTPSNQDSPRRGGQGPLSSSSMSPKSFPIGSSPGRPGPSTSARNLTESGQRPHTPAVSIKLRIPVSARSRPGRDKSDCAAVEVDVEFAPLHTFVDLGSALGSCSPNGKSETLIFVEEIISSEVLTSQSMSNAYDEEIEQSDPFGEGGTPPGTPRASQFGMREQESERERERRRLERIVMEDLDLGIDYRQTTSSNIANNAPLYRNKKRKPNTETKLDIIITIPMIRLQVRGPPPRSCLPRSGAVVLDVHDLRLSPGRELQERNDRSARFAADDPYTTDRNPPNHRFVENAGTTILFADWRRVVVAYAILGEGKAHAIVSLGSKTSDDSTREGLQFGAGISPTSHDVAPSAQPHIHIIRSILPCVSGSSAAATLAVDLEVPSVLAELTKPILDGLQLWADDLTQLMEAISPGAGPWESDTERADSTNTSLIGSRFFAKSRGSSSQASGTERGTTSVTGGRRQSTADETIVKLSVSRAVVRLLVPRDADGVTIRPFDIIASDVDVLIELKPEGKDETVLTLGVMDLTINETLKSNMVVPFVCLTAPHGLVSTLRSAVKLRFTSLVVPETISKESRIKLTLCGITCHVHPDFGWVEDLGRFAKAPPGAFEQVVPSERTRVAIKIIDTSIRALAPSHPGALVPYIGELDFFTVIVGNSPKSSFHMNVMSLSLLLIDDVKAVVERTRKVASAGTSSGGAFWKDAGYALLAEISDLDLKFERDETASPVDTRINIARVDLRLHLCADTAGALGAFIGDLTSGFGSPPEPRPPTTKRKRVPENVSDASANPRGLLSSLDEAAFRQLPEVGAAPDMIYDDLPTNADYLDESFGAAAGLREITDNDLDDFDINSPGASGPDQPGVSRYGGETVRILRMQGLQTIPNYFETITPESEDESSSFGETALRVRIQNCNVTLFLYSGYDWERTRRIIEEERKDMRRRLAKIRQLVASGQTPDPSVEDTSTLLFNSVYIGLEHNVDELEPGALIAAIDEELNEDLETASQSSWQSLKPQPTSPGKTGTQHHHGLRKRMNRSRAPSIEFRLMGLYAEVDNYRPEASLVSRTFVTIKDLEILDHIKTSTWRKFLTSNEKDSRGNVRESESNMVRIELRSLHPVEGNTSEEARLRAKILPLRLHVDQDALDFLKKFFSFKDPESTDTGTSEPEDEIYFQQAEVFPVDLKLDYKPRRVDYRALRDGRTIELMNFFHFDGAEMTLRHITLTGITGWPRFFDLLNDLWTPDVKATQLVDVISGVAPIRSVVNVGSGVADLVLLPIAQYKKDGRVVRGLQKGTTSFVKSAGIEAIKLGARLATGTQVILEQAENVIGGQFKDSVTAETVQSSPSIHGMEVEEDEDGGDLISRYADQPANVKEGVQSAYRSLKTNLNSAAQTILAVPMEVYERSGNEGPVRAVVRAVPIAVLRPMIGATEAVSKTLLGLHNSLDPNVRYENEAKYKQR